jgi:hypothetical protein
MMTPRRGSRADQFRCYLDAGGWTNNVEIIGTAHVGCNEDLFEEGAVSVG